MSHASDYVKDVTNVATNISTLGQQNVASRQRKQTSKTAQDIGLTAPPDEAAPVVPTPVTPMPVPGQDDLANIAARRKSIEQQLFRRGRLSTILSNPLSEPLGA